MKKRVLLLIDDLEQGGAERQMVYLANELKKSHVGSFSNINHYYHNC